MISKKDEHKNNKRGRISSNIMCPDYHNQPGPPVHMRTTSTEGQLYVL